MIWMHTASPRGRMCTLLSNIYIYILPILLVHLCQVQTAGPGGNAMPDAWVQNLRKSGWRGRGEIQQSLGQ